MMASKQGPLETGRAEAPDRGRFWEPPGKRDVLTEAGRKWQEENAEAIAAWREWVEKNGVPLAKYRQF
jgi:antitoxin CcdA